MLYFTNNFHKTDNFVWNCQFFKNCWENMLASAEMSTENYYIIFHYIALPTYPSHFPKFCHIQKQMLRNCWYLVKTTLALYLIFLQTHIFWNFNHVSRICNQITTTNNYRNIWFLKVIIIIFVTVQVLFFNVFSEKDPHLNAIEFFLF